MLQKWVRVKCQVVVFLGFRKKHEKRGIYRVLCPLYENKFGNGTRVSLIMGREDVNEKLWSLVQVCVANACFAVSVQNYSQMVVVIGHEGGRGGVRV